MNSERPTSGPASKPAENKPDPKLLSAPQKDAPEAKPAADKPAEKPATAAAIAEAATKQAAPPTAPTTPGATAPAPPSKPGDAPKTGETDSKAPSAKPGEAKQDRPKPAEAKSAAVPEPPLKSDRPVEPLSLLFRIFRGPTIGVQPKPDKSAPHRAPEPSALRAASAGSAAVPAVAPPADAAKKLGEPTPKPEPPSAPKPATWKSIPAKDDWCPPEIAKHFPDLARHTQHDCAAFERVLASGWRVVGATRRGRDHANKGTHREDALAFATDGPLTVLCVSDGAGSCRFSRIGSHVASRTVAESLRTALAAVEPAVADDREKLLALLKSSLTGAGVAACTALDDMAAKCGCSPKDFRCTLLTALHWRGDKHECWLVSQVGDGAVLVLRRDKSAQRAGKPDSGAHSGEVSCFVPDAGARRKAEVVEVLPSPDEIEAVLLVSDGVEDPFYPVEKTAVDMFRQFYTGVEKPLDGFKSQPAQPPLVLQESAAWALAEWLEFVKPGEFDDRTALLAHRHPANAVF
jgi:serine/threonine protein phosphatase PrpC